MALAYSLCLASLLVLERALLGAEAVAQRRELLVVGGGRELGLELRLEARLALVHPSQCKDAWAVWRGQRGRRVGAHISARATCHDSWSAGAIDTPNFDRSRTLIWLRRHGDASAR